VIVNNGIKPAPIFKVAIRTKVDGEALWKWPLLDFVVSQPGGRFQFTTEPLGKGVLAPFDGPP
jgi:hypothetical protein